MSLAIKNANLTLEAKTILDDVSFAIQPGRLNALIGPNGAGKSSLLRVILGSAPAASAHIDFAGTDFHALPRRSRARIAALVEQTAATDQPIDVHDVVMLGRLPHQGMWAADSETGDEEIAARAMARAPTAHRTHRGPAEAAAPPPERGCGAPGTWTCGVRGAARGPPRSSRGREFG